MVVKGSGEGRVLDTRALPRANSPADADVVSLGNTACERPLRTMAASYFDVDGTLVRSNLLHTAIYYMANDINPVRSVKNLAGMVLRAPSWVLAERQDRRLFNEMLFEVFKGVSQDRLLVLADEGYEWCMKKHIYRGARDLIARCKDAGHEVVLVSGALDFLLSRLAQDLGADHYVGNRLEFKDGYATGKMLRPVVAGPAKSRLMQDHAAARGHDLAQCHAYTDSYSDVPMLAVVGHPTALNPDAKLERLALSYQWPIIRFSKDSN